MQYLMGIDLGTSGLKTVVYDKCGSKIASASAEYPLIQPQNGWAEQEPQEWWEATKKCLKSISEKDSTVLHNVVSIGISGQMHGLVMLDENNEVLRHAILWCDQRTAEECKEITEHVGAERLVEITANPALTGFTASKIMWVKKHQPELYAKCRHILLPKDYLRFKLTGEYATEVSDASGMQLLDVPNRCWSKEVLEKLDIDINLLAKVYESPEITGSITPAVASEVGLKAGTIVVGGAGDNAAAAIGTGVVCEGTSFTTIGTSGVVYLHTDRPKIDPKGRVHTFCAAVPNSWHIMGVTQAAGLSLQWFRNEFCQDLVATATKNDINIYAHMDALANEIPIGADKLLYLPYLMGERTPHLDANCRGVFFGLSAMHTKAHCIRAIMEGVAYSLNDCCNIIKEMGCNISSMTATGGGGTSELWRSMLGDIFNLQINTMQSEEGPALGVAILASVGAGIYSTVQEACKNMVKYGNNYYAPNADNVKNYRQIYDLYQQIYPALKDKFGLLANICSKI